MKEKQARSGISEGMYYLVWYCVLGVLLSNPYIAYADGDSLDILKAMVLLPFGVMVLHVLYLKWKEEYWVAMTTDALAWALLWLGVFSYILMPVVLYALSLVLAACGYGVVSMVLYTLRFWSLILVPAVIGGLFLPRLMLRRASSVA